VTAEVATKAALFIDSPLCCGGYGATGSIRRSHLPIDPKWTKVAWTNDPHPKELLELTAEADNERAWSRLMASAQDGDRAAYEALLRDVVPFIEALVSREQRSKDRIDEVVQDVLLTLHRIRHTYDPSRLFKPWLAAIARRRSIDALRRKGRRAAREVSNDKAYETFADPQANRAMEVYATTEGLNEAIASLPQQQREAVELLKLRELSLAEASQVSGRSVTALKVNVHRAIKALRLRLRGE
jgi:RNA polymerase sigma-70 factor (ECF subfamily)